MSATIKTIIGISVPTRFNGLFYAIIREINYKKLDLEREVGRIMVTMNFEGETLWQILPRESFECKMNL